MSPRRAAISFATMVAAIAVLLALPVSQLRTFSVVVKCCCPNPATCHCPDHQPDRSTQPSMRACHKERTETVAPQAPSFTPTQVALAAPEPRVAPAVVTTPETPHPSPSLEEPYGPS